MTHPPACRRAWSAPPAFVGGTHLSPPERDAVAALVAGGLVDAYRMGTKPSDHAPLLIDLR